MLPTGLSFRGIANFSNLIIQAVKYTKKIDLPAITGRFCSVASPAVFVPLEDEEILAKLSGELTIDNVRLSVVATGWT